MALTIFLSIFMTIIGLGLLVIIIFVNRRIKRIKLSGIETKAEVLKITDTMDDSDLGYRNTIVIGYHSGGKYHEVSTATGKKIKQGDTLKIIYQMDESEKCVIVDDTGKRFVVVSFFLGLLSLAAITGGIFLLLADVIFAQ